MNDQPANAPAPGGKWAKLKQEFTNDPNSIAAFHYHYRVGRLIASSLSGLIAGVIIATIVFVPWLIFLSKFCSVR